MFETIISLGNLCAAWHEFLPGKKFKNDVAEFSLNLSRNLYALHEDLRNRFYKHGGYKAFGTNDPKPRNIHKATVCDRVLHHAIYRVLYPYFDRKFICDTYSCRNDRGVHRAMRRFEVFARKVSKNNTRTCWVLKCDIQKFFASISHSTLLHILGRYIPDRHTIWLLGRVVGSFTSNPGKGLPLGNLTSQLLANVYMNEFDQFIKHNLKVKHYIRYADDFVILSYDKKYLQNLLPIIDCFLNTHFSLYLHPKKISINTIASGVDFLGWIHFPDHRVLRTTTKRRMFKKIIETQKPETIQSYLGLLKHGNTYALQEKILEDYHLSSNTLS